MWCRMHVINYVWKKYECLFLSKISNGVRNFTDITACIQENWFELPDNNVQNRSEKTIHKLDLSQQTLWVTERAITRGAAILGLRPEIKLWWIISPRQHNQSAWYFSSRCFPLGSTGLTCIWLSCSVFSGDKLALSQDEHGPAHKSESGYSNQNFEVRGDIWKLLNLLQTEDRCFWCNLQQEELPLKTELLRYLTF